MSGTGVLHRSLWVGSKNGEMIFWGWGVWGTSISCCESSIMRVLLIAGMLSSSEDGEADDMTVIESWTTRSTFFFTPQDLPPNDDVRPTESTQCALFEGGKGGGRFLAACCEPPFDWILFDCWRTGRGVK